MLKKAVLMVVATMLIVFGASAAFANQVDGMRSGTGPALPTGIQASINPGGLGDSLLYGYYNVRGGAFNLFNIVNTSATDGAKVRVIFRNAKNSKECLDFSVCLSHSDVWTAYLIDNGTTASIFAYDTDTLTAPIIPVAGQPFKAGTYSDGYVVTDDDCREGYFEVVGLANIPNYDKKACVASPSQCPLTGGATEAACRDYAPVNNPANSVGNVLMGNNAIAVTTNFATFQYNAVAIADTSLGVPTTPAAGSDYSIALAMDNGCPEADYIFMKSAVAAPFDIISGFGAEELILTFPTRYVCHKDQAGGIFEGASGNTDGTKADTYCAKITPTLWTDAEVKQDVSQFSPGLTLCLPYEVNVIRLGGKTQIWNSTVASTIATDFGLGWVTIDLTGTNHQISYGGNTAHGLPAVAYQTQSYLLGIATYMAPMAYQSNITIP